MTTPSPPQDPRPDQAASTDTSTDVSTDAMTDVSTDAMTDVSTDVMTDVSTDAMTDVSTDVMTGTTETPPAPVLVTRQAGVTTITLNRPEAMNALDLALKTALLAALREAADDPEVRCVVLTGSGRAFCVGQDLKEHVAGLRSGELLSGTVAEHYNPIALLVATMDKPVVAALGGVAAGAGASIALAADLRVMSDQSGLNTAFAGIALSCDTGSSWTLPRMVGVARAKELLLFPRTVPAAECLELGLATKVVAPDELEATVAELASTLAAGPTRAYGAIRRAVAFSAAHDLAASLDHEAELMASTGETSDHRAAVDAFLAKEAPVYTGR